MDLEWITLTGMPLPPSANALHRSIGRGRVLKSAKYLAFERECQVWVLQNQASVATATQFVQKACGPGAFLNINCKFFMHKHRILSHANLPLANDTSNRLKAAHDAVAAILGIDDKFFWNGSFTKVSIAENVAQWMTVELSRL